MPTPRSVAQDEGYHYLLQIWPSEHHRDVGGESFRAATGLYSRSGNVVTLDGLTYPPVLDPTLRVMRYASTAAASVTLRLVWDRDTQAPSAFDLRDAVGDLYLADETGGTSIGYRTLLVSGRITAYTWGDSYEALTVTLSGRQIVDDGDWYGPGAEITSDRFSDIAETGDRDRAQSCDGLLPPLTWAPVGSQMRVPAYRIRNETDAVSGVSDLVYARQLISYRKPTNTSAAEQFAMTDPDRDGGWIDSTNSTEQQLTPASTTDGEGDTYWYVDWSAAFTIGSSSLTITNGSADVTVSKSRRLVREGWQLKGSTGGLDDYVPVVSVDGTAVELSTTYGGATVTNGSGNSIPLPGDNADAIYWIPALGGIDRGDGTPLTICTEVLIDWLRLCDLGVDVAYGDLSALTNRLGEITISYCRRERGSPWAMVLEVLRYLPIRPVLSEGLVRFKWTGPPTDDDVVATMDLTDVGQGVYRAEPFRWAEEEPAPLIDLRYHWDAYREIYRGALSISQDSTIGRAVEAYYAVPRPGRVQMDLDTIESLGGIPRLVGLWILYGSGHARRVIEVEVDATWRWLEALDVLDVDSRYWRVEALGWDAVGSGRLLLEECPV